jgi:hypothetical protein
MRKTTLLDINSTSEAGAHERFVSRFLRKLWVSITCQADETDDCGDLHDWGISSTYLIRNEVQAFDFGMLA